MGDKPEVLRIAEALEHARKHITDARVIGALSDDRETYQLSLLVGALEKHASVLQAHVSALAGKLP